MREFFLEIVADHGKEVAENLVGVPAYRQLYHPTPSAMKLTPRSINGHNPYKPYSPGHRVEQGTRWMASPGQGSPPLRGTGLVQDLVRRWYPFPHRLLHSLHCPQVDQAPLTENRKMTNFTVFKSLI